jgi:uracil-DNA glycosylase family 4
MTQPAPKRLQIVQPRPANYDPRAHGALCDECPARGTPVVPPLQAAIPIPDAVLVGQEPGFEEQRRLLPFVGPSGKKVDRMLEKFGLNRERMHITNAALCLPKDEKDRLKCIECCRPRLDQELAAIPKSVPIVPLGAHALYATMGRKMPISIARGFVWLREDREYYPTLHPAFVLRDHIQAPLFSRDFRRIAKRVLEGKLELEAPKSFSVPRSDEELKRLLAKFGSIVSCDIETTEEPPTIAQMLCIGIAGIPTAKPCIVIPWQDSFGPILNEFFKTKTAVFHNGFAFDSIVMARYGIDLPLIEDTLIAHHVYASHFPQRMDHLVSMYSDAEPWKVKFGKRGSSNEKGQPKLKLVKQESEDDLLRYNSYDAHHQAKLWPAIQEDLKPWLKLYNEVDKPLAMICRKMQTNGILVDQKRKDELSAAIKVKEERLTKELKEIAGWDFAYTKPVDIRKILYEQYRAPIIERTKKTGMPSTAKKTLQAFAMTNRPYGVFCKKLVELRGCRKMRITYLDNLSIEHDGRVRASWRSFGTPTGRFAVRSPNLANLKRFDKRYKDDPEQKIREIYIAAPGHILVSFDMSQVEPRIAAYISGDPNFIASVESGDIHTANAIILFGELPELMDPKEAKEGKGKSMRDISKQCGLAVSYGAGDEKIYETLRSYGFDVKLSQVQIMLKRLHKGYGVFFGFVEKNTEFCRKHGYITAGFMTGRRRYLGHAPEPGKISNTPIQGGAADCMNDRLIKLDKAVPTECKIVSQVYDSVVYETPLHMVDRLKEIIVKVMGEPYEVDGRKFALPVDLKIGQRLSEV